MADDAAHGDKAPPSTPSAELPLANEHAAARVPAARDLTPAAAAGDPTVAVGDSTAPVETPADLGESLAASAEAPADLGESLAASVEAPADLGESTPPVDQSSAPHGEPSGTLEPEFREPLAARSEPFVQERGLYRAPRPPRAWSPVRRTLLLGVGFAAPCAVIALSLYFIVRGGTPHEALSAAPSARAAAPDAGAAPQLAEGPDEEAAAVAAAGPSASANAGLENSAIAVPGFEDEGSDEEPSPAKPAPPKHFATVQEAALGSCSTESVDGLSRQIIEQARCIKPNDFVALPKRPNLIMKPQVFPYLEMAARDHLLKALDAHPKQNMTINSALRTVAQQYLVSHWAATRICGVQLATRPGESNHEIGSALDIAEAGTWRPALEAQQFRWLGSSDRVHFDYKGDNAPPRTATDVLAFQKLWNKNHTDDPIPENGQYGPPTEQRLKKSPPSGFPLGSSCRPTARKR